MFCFFAGAYIFRPNGTLPFAVNDGPVAVSVQQTDTVTVVSQTWANWLTSEIRLWNGLPDVEVEFSVGPVPIGDGLGKVWRVAGTFFSASISQFCCRRCYWGSFCVDLTVLVV